MRLSTLLQQPEILWADLDGLTPDDCLELAHLRPDSRKTVEHFIQIKAMNEMRSATVLALRGNGLVSSHTARSLLDEVDHSPRYRVSPRCRYCGSRLLYVTTSCTQCGAPC